MRLRSLNFVPFVAGSLLASGLSGHAQQAGPAHASGAGTAQGQLTVTATVVSSVGVVIGPDGEAQVIVANAADRAENLGLLLAPRGSAGRTTMNLKKNSASATNCSAHLCIVAKDRVGSNVTRRKGNVTELEDTKQSSKVFERFAVGGAGRRILGP